jgi:hypothetical protein
MLGPARTQYVGVIVIMICTLDASSPFTPRRAFVTTNRNARMSFLAKSSSSSNSWNEEHLIHGAGEIHEDTDEELRESEMAAAFDAHDCSDPGMEAAMEERALMMAHDMAHQLKEKALQQDKVAESTNNKMENWNAEHLIHGAHELHEETDAELRESEDAAAMDAHDCNDPGMEAAMEEYAVMLARELTHKTKEEANKARQNDGKN